MIVVDTSALVAIALEEPEANRCQAVLARAEEALISAVTLTEALIVSRRRRFGEEMDRLVAAFGIDVVACTEADARRAAGAHDRFGKGVHPAGLNLGDCFAYALARHRNCPLLFVGDDFSRTDITPAI